MNFPPLIRWALWAALVFGAQTAAAQMPLPDGAERHPSDYRYPLRTWNEDPPQKHPERGRVRVSPAIKDRADAYTALTHKLQSIVIPRVEFRRATLADAIGYLRQESQRLDPDSDPRNRGVNIFLQPAKTSFATSTVAAANPDLPASLAWPAPADANVRITLTMERLPLLEALKYVASQAGLKVAIEPYAVSLGPPSYVIQNLVTAEYGVPPELLGLSPDARVQTLDKDVLGGNSMVRSEMTSWFCAKGVDFPPGASAVYLPDKRKLVVRNTQENLDKIVSVISCALKPADLTPANP